MLSCARGGVPVSATGGTDVLKDRKISAFGAGVPRLILPGFTGSNFLVLTWEIGSAGVIRKAQIQQPP